MDTDLQKKRVCMGTMLAGGGAGLIYVSNQPIIPVLGYNGDAGNAILDTLIPLRSCLRGGGRGWVRLFYSEWMGTYLTHHWLVSYLTQH